jgi:hypothetical protein
LSSYTIGGFSRRVLLHERVRRTKRRLKRKRKRRKIRIVRRWRR